MILWVNFVFWWYLNNHVGSSITTTVSVLDFATAVQVGVMCNIVF